MRTNIGTPKTLTEAIENADIDSTGFVRNFESDFRISIKNHVVDFLSQKFGAAILNYPDCEQVLMQLFNDIKNEEK